MLPTSAEEGSALTHFTMSPEYEADHTVYAAGWSPGLVNRRSLHVSHDGGATWVRRAAVGMRDQAEILLPPAYPRDRRLFSVGASGLQVSYDDGESFETLVAAVPEAFLSLTDVAFSPSFGRGDDAMLLSVGGRLLEYHYDTDELLSVRLVGPAAQNGGHRVRYASDSSGEVVAYVVGHTRAEKASLATDDLTKLVSRCTRDRTAQTGDKLVEDRATVVFHCDRGSVVPNNLWGMEVSPGGSLFVQTTYELLVSDDGGASFTPAFEAAMKYSDWLADVQIFGSKASWSAVIAQGPPWPGVNETPFHWTRDGGRTWQTVSMPSDPRKMSSFKMTPTGRILAVFVGKGFMCSEDAGRTWAPACPTPEP